ncbi:MAG: MFS transporter [Candidatus Amulumruptor caecigallinarius]|nr:MFS transporter [Candidatus Amulumruptor caecigallinarius]
MASNTSLKVRLAVMNFIEFAVWGSYLISLGNFLSKYGFGAQIGWFYSVQGLVSLIMPGIIGILADRWLQAQKMLSLCHLLAAIFMGLAGWYCASTLAADNAIEFAPLFTFYTCSVAFFMPTIGLANSVAYSALSGVGLDTVKHFPPIRIWGTIGFIVAMLLVNFIGPEDAKFQTSYMQLFMSAGFSLLMAVFALTMPACPTNKAASTSLTDALGLRAFSLFKQKKMAVFFIFSMLLGVSLQITNGYANPFITFFSNIEAYSHNFFARNANLLISLSQLSETLCILLIPFCLKKYGIKGVMLIAMFAWVFRFGFFGLGNPGQGVWLFILSMIVYGVAFDFFNVSGSLYVDNETDPSMRSSAQGLFMIMTNGIGATIGTLAAQGVVNHFVNDYPEGTDPMVLLQGWKMSWYCFAGYALVVAVLFWIIFKDSDKNRAGVKVSLDTAGADADPAGLVVENGNV